MRYVSNLLINDFKLMENKMDFMGYKVQRKESLTFHHFLVPKRECKKVGLGDGYIYDNGVMLGISHPYLHVTEHYDYDLFCAITSEMLDMKIKGHLDLDNLRRIHEMLEEFEYMHRNHTSKKDKPIIKPEFITERRDLSQVDEIIVDKGFRM